MVIKNIWEKVLFCQQKKVQEISFLDCLIVNVFLMSKRPKSKSGLSELLKSHIVRSEESPIMTFYENQ